MEAMKKTPTYVKAYKQHPLVAARRKDSGQEKMLPADGVPAIWQGGTRRCGSYPALENGMPGHYVYKAEKYCSMFYPAAWKYRFGVYAAEQSVRLTAEGA